MQRENVIDDLLAKYRRIWFLRLTPELLYLKSLSPEQIKSLHEDRDRYLRSWEGLVWNENKDRLKQPIEKLLAFRELTQDISLLLFPQWIMDRFKEALDQYARGEWLSSIALCGAIVELVTADFFRAYPKKIPKGQFPKKREVTKNLKKLRKFGIITGMDYRRLSEVRRIRDGHVHLRLLGRGVELLRSENAKALRKLCGFFDESNMKQNYKEYFLYAGRIMGKSFQASGQSQS